MIRIKPFVTLLLTYFIAYYLIMVFISSYMIPVGKTEIAIHAILATGLMGLFSFKSFMQNE